jgi:hypothetical protein
MVIKGADGMGGITLKNHAHERGALTVEDPTRQAYPMEAVRVPETAGRHPNSV